MLKWIATVAMAGFLMVGCSSGGLSQEAQEALGLEGAPKWVAMGDGPYSAVGSAPIINKNIGFAKSEALTKAQAELVKKFSNKMQASTQSTSIRKDAALTEQVKEEIMTLAQADVKDSQVADMWATPDGKNIFVLVKLSDEAVAKMKKAIENGGGDFGVFEKNMAQPTQEQPAPAQ